MYVVSRAVWMRGRDDLRVFQGRIRSRGRRTYGRGVKNVSGGEGVRALSQHNTSHAPLPLSTDTFGPVSNHCKLETTTLSACVRWVVSLNV